MAKKTRVDTLLVEQGLIESRSRAQRLVMAGQVRADGQLVHKPAQMVRPEAELTIKEMPRFVSRGGKKLLAAFEVFDLDVADRICADVGASTGGFTDCLLQHGASKVYAIDVGKGILHWKMRSDPRVVVMEETNARYLENLPEPVSFVTIDASFISLKLLLPMVHQWFSPLLLGEEPGLRSEAVVLIKPQFEAGRKEAAKGRGVIRDPKIHRRVLREILTFAQEQGFSLRGLAQSPVVGPKGNIEFLAWLAWPRDGEPVPVEKFVTPLFT